MRRASAPELHVPKPATLMHKFQIKTALESDPRRTLGGASEPGFSVVSEGRDSDWRIVGCGELDIATVELLERGLLAAEQTDADTIVLDLSRLSFIDSTGLKLLLDPNERSAGADRLRIIARAPALERLLDIVGPRERLPLIAP